MFKFKNPEVTPLRLVLFCAGLWMIWNGFERMPSTFLSSPRDPMIFQSLTVIIGGMTIIMLTYGLMRKDEVMKKLCFWGLLAMAISEVAWISVLNDRPGMVCLCVIAILYILYTMMHDLGASPKDSAGT